MSIKNKFIFYVVWVLLAKMRNSYSHARTGWIKIDQLLINIPFFRRLFIKNYVKVQTKNLKYEKIISSMLNIKKTVDFSDRKLIVNISDVSRSHDKINRLIQQIEAVLTDGNIITDIEITNADCSNQELLGFVIFKIALRYLEHLKKLEFNLLRCRQEDFTVLCESLRVQSRFLQSVSFKVNDIGDIGVRQLVSCGFKFIVCLKLDCNRITSEGARSISEAGWTYLSNLQLQGNKIKNKGLYYLSKVKWRYLKSLNISHNEITQDGVKILSKFRFPELNILRIEQTHLTNTNLKEVVKLHLPNCRFICIVSQNNLKFSQDQAFMPWKQCVKLNPNSLNLVIMSQRIGSTDRIKEAVSVMSRVFRFVCE